MPSLTTLAIILTTGIVVYGLARAILAQIVAAGADAARARRLEGELRAARRQGEIMAEHRSADDVADDLDRGRY